MDGDALGEAVARLAREPAFAGLMAEAARAKVEEMSGANRRAVDALEPFIVQAQLERQARGE